MRVTAVRLAMPASTSAGLAGISMLKVSTSLMRIGLTSAARAFTGARNWLANCPRPAAPADSKSCLRFIIQTSKKNLDHYLYLAGRILLRGHHTERRRAQHRSRRAEERRV